MRQSQVTVNNKLENKLTESVSHVKKEIKAWVNKATFNIIWQRCMAYICILCQFSEYSLFRMSVLLHDKTQHKVPQNTSLLSTWKMSILKITVP